MAKQIGKKWIADGAIDGSKIKLLEGQSLVIEVAGQDVELLKVAENGNAVLPQGEVPSTQAVNDAIATEVTALNTQIQTDIQTQIAAETTAREAAITSVEQSVAAETQARESAIQTVEQSVQSAQTDISGLESGLAQEILDRQSGDASTLSSAQSYADQKVAEIVNSAPEVLDTLKELADALGSDPNFATTVAGQIGAVDDKVDQEILDRQAGDSATLTSAQSYADSAVASEASARQSADSALQTAINDLSGVVQGNFDLQQSDIDLLRSDVEALSGLGADLEDLDAYAQDTRVDLDNLDAYAQDIRVDLDSEIASRQSADASNLQEAKDYADQKVAALVNSAPEVLDTLKELSDALGGDENFAATVAGQIGAVDDKVDQEILDRQSADSLLDNRISALENAPDAVIFEEDKKFEVDGINVNSSYIDLPHLAKAVLKVGVNRLNAYKNQDYTVSEVGGVTRITWTNDLAANGLSEIAGGDFIYVTYAR